MPRTPENINTTSNVKSDSEKISVSPTADAETGKQQKPVNNSTPPHRLFSPNLRGGRSFGPRKR